MLEFVTFNSKKLKLNKRSLLNILEFENEKEKSLVEYTLKKAIRRSTKIYFLKIKKFIGVVALSASSVIIEKEIFPAINIDLLFVSKSYRKSLFNELNNKKISEILLDFCIEITQEIKEKIGIRYISLYPYNNETKLIHFYEKYGFIKLKDNFMILKI